MRVLVTVKFGVIVEAHNSLAAMQQVESWADQIVVESKDAGIVSRVASVSADPIPEGYSDNDAMNRLA